MKKPKILFLGLILITIFEAGLLLTKGVIKVLEKKTSTTPCENTKEVQKLKCFEDLLDKTLQDKGVSEAFEVLANIYQEEPQFGPECHGFTHKLGDKAYELFSKDKDLAFSTKSSYCGYGFYHGFMENLLHTSGDIKEAQDFCKKAGEKLKDQTSDAEGSCYHGIGHGAVEDVSDPSFWGSSQKIIQPSLDLCEKVAPKDHQRHGKLFRCVSGVFNALEIVTTQGKYRLSHNADDPFAICRVQKENYKEACFTQFVVAVMNITGNNFTQSAKIIDSIKENDYAIPTLQSLVVELVHQNKTDYQQTLNFCRDLSSRFQIPCISAFAEGFMKYGPPQEEFVEALNFCNSNLLKDEEKKECFTRILSILRIWYTQEKSKEICQSIDQKYRWQNCQYN